MASEMRRAAQALVERQPRSIRSDYPVDESADRLRALFASGRLAPLTGDATPIQVVIRATPGGDEIFVGHWTSDATGVCLDGEFLPGRRTQRHLKGLAITLTLLVAACLWAFLGGQDTATRASLALITAFAVLAFPYVILGLSSQRAGREGALAQVLKRTLEREPK